MLSGKRSGSRTTGHPDGVFGGRKILSPTNEVRSMPASQAITATVLLDGVWDCDVLIDSEAESREYIQHLAGNCDSSKLDSLALVALPRETEA